MKGHKVSRHLGKGHICLHVSLKTNVTYVIQNQMIGEEELQEGTWYSNASMQAVKAKGYPEC